MQATQTSTNQQFAQQLWRGAMGDTDASIDTSILDTLPALHPTQQHIYDDVTRYKVLVCGRRFGKTELMTRWLIEGAVQGELCAYFTPTREDGEEVWEYIIGVLEDAGIPVNKHETHRWIKFRGGGVIKFWSLEKPDRSRGRKYHRIAVDEAAMAPRLEYAWLNVIRATLVDYKGKALFGSSPKGMNYFHTLYQNGVDDNKAEWAEFQYTSYDNPHIDPAEIDSAREEVPSESPR